MNRVLTWLIATACVTAFFVAKDYLPKRKSPVVAQAEDAVKYQKRREAAALPKLADAKKHAEETRRMVAATDAPLKRNKLAYDFGKTHLDTTDIDSVKAQLRRADSVVRDQSAKIAALEADTAAKAKVILRQGELLVIKDEKAEALERLNAGIRAEIPTRRQKLVHDAKVAAFTAAGLGALQLVFGQ